MSDTGLRSSLVLPCPHCGTANRVPAERLSHGGKCGKCGRPLFTGQPVTLTSSSFDRHARAELPLVVDFWAAWCGPCKAMAPIFAAAARDFEPRLRFGKVDTEAERDLAARYQIRSIPTLILFKGGREIARQSGALPAEMLRHWLDQHVPG